MLDTNVFLEILLDQAKKEECKKFLNDNIEGLNVTDFSLHSIGVILFRYGRKEVFQKFVEEAEASLLRKEMENRVIEVRANELAREQQKTSLRMSDWRRLKNQARREWMRELRARYTIEIHQEALEKLLQRFQSLVK